MEWEIPPHSKCGKITLVATEKINDKVYLTFAGDTPIYHCSLDEVQTMDEHMQQYISDLMPKILEGAYDINLIRQY